jgi:hypothetical protein
LDLDEWHNLYRTSLSAMSGTFFSAALRRSGAHKGAAIDDEVPM